jgi:hypothetical protein
VRRDTRGDLHGYPDGRIASSFNGMHLILLSIKERWRRSERQVGMVGTASLYLLILIAVYAFASAVHNFPGLSDARLERALVSAWTAWLVVGALTGRDLFWHAGVDRFRFLGASLRQVYVLQHVLAFLSLPLISVGAGVAFIWLSRVRAAGQPLALVSISLPLLALVARLSISVARAIVMDFDRTDRRKFVVLGTTSTAVVIGLLLPVKALSRMHYNAPLIGLSLTGSLPSLLILASAASLLMAFDFALFKRRVERSLIATGTRGAARVHLTRLLFFWYGHGAGALVSLALLGFLRNRAALLLFIWGTAYGFGWVYRTKPDTPTSILLYFWMIAMFHSYIRGNLFGVDRRAVWWYFSVPDGAVLGLRAKNYALTLLQGVMFTAVVSAAILRRPGVFARPTVLLALLASGVILIASSQIAGSFTSIFFPEPIERHSQYSGGTAVGALIVPAVSTVLLLPLMLLLSPRTGVQEPVRLALLLTVACVLCAVIAWVTPAAMRSAFTSHSDRMRRQLSAFRT